jgi:hypothetical protein
MVKLVLMLLCNECGEGFWDESAQSVNELRDLAHNRGWKEKQNDIDLCEQCRHIISREGE